MATEIRESKWAIKDLTTGWLMTEGCVLCGAKRSFVSHETTPPLDSYVEGIHYWRDFESARTFRFDLMSRETGAVLKLDSVLGLALCKSCDSSCLVSAINKLLKPDKVRVYVALCADPFHVSSKCASSEQIVAVTDYLNSRRKGPMNRVLVLPCIFRKKPESCRSRVMAEIDGIDRH